MNTSTLIKIITDIVNRSVELKNTFTNVSTTQVEFACVFCQNEEEYKKYTDTIQKIGKVVQTTPSGHIYLLSKPIITSAGPLRLVKIRKPDPQRIEKGDADFNTDYESFKNTYKKDPKFEYIKRETFEMLRLSDPTFNVMACFSSIPKSKELGIIFFNTPKSVLP